MRARGLTWGQEVGRVMRSRGDPREGRGNQGSRSAKRQAVALRTEGGPALGRTLIRVETSRLRFSALGSADRLMPAAARRRAVTVAALRGPVVRRAAVAVSGPVAVAVALAVAFAVLLVP